MYDSNGTSLRSVHQVIPETTILLGPKMCRFEVDTNEFSTSGAVFSKRISKTSVN